MKKLNIYTFEELHHVCLMHGLKKAFLRLPFLCNNPLASPPPIRRKPDRKPLFISKTLNPVSVQYFRQDVQIFYDETRVADSEACSFARMLLEEYLQFRHPYMKSVWNANSLLELSSGRVLAEIKESDRQ